MCAAVIGRVLAIVLAGGSAIAWAGQPPQGAAGAGPALIVAAGTREVPLTEEDLAGLPAAQLAITVETGQGGRRQLAFEGPLLWTVLERAGALDAADPHSHVRQAVLVTGRDGYTAVLALAEAAPGFEGKQVVLASRMNGQPLGPGHLRLAVPGDRRGGRGVHDVARITVLSPQAPPGSSQ